MWLSLIQVSFTANPTHLTVNTSSIFTKQQGFKTPALRRIVIKTEMRADAFSVIFPVHETESAGTGVSQLGG
jgi:hypothetical protein